MFQNPNWNIFVIFKQFSQQKHDKKLTFQKLSYYIY